MAISEPAHCRKAANTQMNVFKYTCTYCLLDLTGHEIPRRATLLFPVFPGADAPECSYSNEFAVLVQVVYFPRFELDRAKQVVRIALRLTPLGLFSGRSVLYTVAAHRTSTSEFTY